MRWYGHFVRLAGRLLGFTVLMEGRPLGAWVAARQRRQYRSRDIALAGRGQSRKALCVVESCVHGGVVLKLMAVKVRFISEKRSGHRSN